MAGDYRTNKIGGLTGRTVDTLAGHAKTYLNYDQSAASILGSFNISSTSDGGTGRCEMAYTVAMANANYSFSGMAGEASGTGNRWLAHRGTTVTKSTTQMAVSGFNSSGSEVDCDSTAVVIHGDLSAP